MCFKRREKYWREKIEGRIHENVETNVHKEDALRKSFRLIKLVRNSYANMLTIMDSEAAKYDLTPQQMVALRLIRVKDKRSNRLCLTDEGEEILDKIKSSVKSVCMDKYSDVSHEEIDNATSVISWINDILSTYVRESL